MRYSGRSVRRHMGAAEASLHAVMILCTFGLWYPVYRHRRNTLKRTERHYS